jgi:hypothetical protein
MKTAVEWLIERIESERYKKELFEKAKEMEKEQIERAFLDGLLDLETSSEEYYKKTFKSE